MKKVSSDVLKMLEEFVEGFKVLNLNKVKLIEEHLKISQRLFFEISTPIFYR